MPRVSWKDVLAWLTAAFFLVGGTANAFISEENAANYLRWGYPDWFHFVTAACELTAAVLIAYRPTRQIGAALGALVMLAAAATVIRNGEYTHAILPLVVLVLAATVFAQAKGRKS